MPKANSTCYARGNRPFSVKKTPTFDKITVAWQLKLNKESW